MLYRGRTPSAPRDRARRALLALVLAASALFIAAPAFAGTYMDRAALLISQADRETDYLRARLSDRELAHVVHEMAAARFAAASTMQVPKAVQQVHPHVLLVLENYERAARFASEGDRARFFVYLHKARNEERIMLDIFKELGWPLPKVP